MRGSSSYLRTFWTGVANPYGRRKKSRTNRYQRRARLETLEERRVLDGSGDDEPIGPVADVRDPSDDLVPPDHLQNVADEDVKPVVTTTIIDGVEYKLIGTLANHLLAITAPGQEGGLPTLGVKDSAEVPVDRHIDMVLEVRPTPFTGQRYQLSVEFMSTTFLDAFLSERLAMASSDVSDISSQQARDLVGRIESDGTIRRPSGGDTPSRDAVIDESLGDFIQLAKSVAGNGALLSAADRIGLYRGLEKLAATLDAEIASPETAKGRNDALGESVLLLGQQLAQDAESADQDLAASANELADSLVGQVASQYTLWTGLDITHELIRRTTEKDEYIFTLLDTDSYRLSDRVAIDFGHEASLEARVGSVSEHFVLPRTLAATIDGALVTDTYISSSSASTNYGTAAELEVAAGGANEREAFFNFDVSAHAGKFVDDATATLHMTTLTGSGAQNQAEVVLSEWADDQLTWDDRSGLEIGPAIDDPWNAAADTDANIDVAEAAQRALRFGDMNFTGSFDPAGVVGDIEAFHLAVVDRPAYHGDRILIPIRTGCFRETRYSRRLFFVCLSNFLSNCRV